MNSNGHLNGNGSVLVSQNGVSTDGRNADIQLIKSDRPAELFYSYDQGVLDGMLEARSYHFEQFIDAYHYREYKNKSIYYLRGQIKELLDKKALATQHTDTLKEQKGKKEAERASCTFRLDYLNKVIQYWDGRIVEAKENLREIISFKTDYNLFAGLIFFVFAILFIAADYAICLDIVANSLKIGFENGKKTANAYLFALAMSGLAVVLKPAYDRLIEKPYHQSGRKRAFNLVIIVMAICVIGMLFSLGVFREMVLSSGLMDASQQGGFTTNVVTPPVDVNAAAKIAHSIPARIGIVSSTILFAIAGAICLGISIPVIHRNFRNFWNRFRSRRWEFRRFRFFELVSNSQSQQASLDAEITILNQKIDSLSKEINVDDIIKEKQTLIHIYLHGEKTQNAEKSKALYLAGYERGGKLIGKVPQDWIFEKVSNSGHTNSEANDSILSGKQIKNDNGIGYRTRPFVALRKMIARNFKKSWSEGKEIETEYYNFE
jgi:hypothetical protein